MRYILILLAFGLFIGCGSVVEEAVNWLCYVIGKGKNSFGELTGGLVMNLSLSGNQGRMELWS